MRHIGLPAASRGNTPEHSAHCKAVGRRSSQWDLDAADQWLLRAGRKRHPAPRKRLAGGVRCSRLADRRATVLAKHWTRPAARGLGQYAGSVPVARLSTMFVADRLSAAFG